MVEYYRYESDPKRPDRDVTKEVLALARAAIALPEAEPFLGDLPALTTTSAALWRYWSGPRNAHLTTVAVGSRLYIESIVCDGDGPRLVAHQLRKAGYEPSPDSQPIGIERFRDLDHFGTVYRWHTPINLGQDWYLACVMEHTRTDGQRDLFGFAGGRQIVLDQQKGRVQMRKWAGSPTVAGVHRGFLVLEFLCRNGQIGVFANQSQIGTIPNSLPLSLASFGWDEIGHSYFDDTLYELAVFVGPYNAAIVQGYRSTVRELWSS